MRELKISEISLWNNSRAEIRTRELSELMSSIKEQGVLQPVGVKEVEGEYKLVFGHRRFAACKKLGKKTIPAMILEDETDAESIVNNITENLQREDISLYEQGRMIHSLITDHDMTIGEVAVKLGCSAKKVSDIKSAFHKTPEEFRNKVARSVGHGKTRAGRVPLSVATAINNVVKTNGLAPGTTSKLFTLAEKGFLTGSNIESIALMIGSGVDTEEAIESQKEIQAVHFKIPMLKEDYQALKEAKGAKWRTAINEAIYNAGLGIRDPMKDHTPSSNRGPVTKRRRRSFGSRNIRK